METDYDAQVAMIKQWWNSSPQLIVGFAALLILVAVAYGSILFRRKRRRKEVREIFKTMSRRSQEELLQELASDWIVIGVEAAVNDGTVTRSAANKFYKRLAHHVNLTDLLPQPRVDRKARIRFRLANGHNDPVPLPDATPLGGLSSFFKRSTPSA